MCPVTRYRQQGTDLEYSFTPTVVAISTYISIQMPNTPANANQPRKSVAAAAPKGSRSKKKGVNKSSNPQNIPEPGTLDTRRSGDVEALAGGDIQQDKGAGAQSMLQKYNEIQGG